MVAGVIVSMHGLSVVDEEGAVGMNDAARGARHAWMAQLHGANGVLDGGAVLQPEVSLKVVPVDELLMHDTDTPDLDAFPQYSTRIRNGGTIKN